jgi:hypothetical protein
MHDRVNRLLRVKRSGPSRRSTPHLAAARVMPGRLHLGASCRFVAALRFHELNPANDTACELTSDSESFFESPHLTSPLDTGALETEVKLCVYPHHAAVSQSQLLRSMQACMHALKVKLRSLALAVYTGRWLRGCLTKRASMSGRRRLP